MLLEICYKNVDPLANICRREEMLDLPYFFKPLHP